MEYAGRSATHSALVSGQVVIARLAATLKLFAGRVEYLYPLQAYPGARCSPRVRMALEANILRAQRIIPAQIKICWLIA
jgi:hypothetical protein